MYKGSDGMKKYESTVRIIHTVLCALHLGCLFFGIMKAVGTDNIIYRIFRWLSLVPLYMFPTYLMRVFSLQAVFFTLLAVWSIILYTRKIVKKSVQKNILIYDISLWALTAGELLFLEEYYLSIRYW